MKRLRRSLIGVLRSERVIARAQGIDFVAALCIYGPRMATVAVKKTQAKRTSKAKAKGPSQGKTTPKDGKTTRKAAEKTTKTDKHPGGRPTDYDPEVHPALAEAWASAGRTDKQIAEKLGIVEATLNNWKKAHPEFLESLKKGKADPDDQVEACLFARAVGYNHAAVKIFMPAGARAPVYAKYVEHCPPDVTAILAWLNNRRPERWRNRHELVGPNGGPLEISKLSPAERKARIAELQSKLGGEQ